MTEKNTAIPTLDPNGALTLRPVSDYAAITQTDLRMWCHRYARYGVPTLELIDWLHSFIGNRRAIEIGAGSGDLCHHLGIPGYDNYQQTWLDVKSYYDDMRQPTIKYGSWVKRMDALDAVRGEKPQVVIGSWITHWIDPNKPAPPGGGNMYGVKEDELLDLVDMYVMIGNLKIHGLKPIMKRPHAELEFSWLKSRAGRPDLDRIFVWTGAG